MSSRQLGWCWAFLALAWLPVAATVARAEPIQLVALTPALAGDPGMPPAASELDCLALNVYWEARSEPRRGQIAVAAVTLNRVADPAFPDTVCGVVRQGEERGRDLCQFSWHCDGLDDRPRNPSAWQDARRLAQLALGGQLPDPTGGALWFHSNSVHPDWTGDMARIGSIGTHVFYRLASTTPLRVATVGRTDPPSAARAGAAGEAGRETVVAALSAERHPDPSLPAASMPRAGTGTVRDRELADGSGQPDLAMALATSSQQDFLSLVEELRLGADRAPGQDQAAQDARAPRLVLVSDLPERLDADPFEALLSSGALRADAGAASAEPSWPGGSFGPGVGRGAALTLEGLGPARVAATEVEPAPRSADVPLAPSGHRALPASQARGPERGTLGQSLMVIAQAVVPRLPAFTPAQLLGAFEPPALIDRAPARSF